MKEYDVLFLHTCRLKKDDFEYPLFPIGFIPMASVLSREFDVRIVNLPLEKALSRAHFDVETFLRQSFESKIVAIDLHFWVHSYDSIQLAKLCKEINPNCLVVLGGYTASFFSREIMMKFPFVDVVIRGDGEIPILSLANNHLGGKSIRDVPNSVVREDGKIHENPISYTPDSLDDLNFTDVSLLEHWEDHLWLYTKPTKYDPSRGDTVFNPWLSIARGCKFNCSFCGGTNEAQWLCAGRRGISLRSPEKVVEDISFLESVGVRAIEFSHGPSIVGEKNFSEILSLMRKEAVDIKGAMELWQLPTIDFMKGLERSFSDLMFRVNFGSGSEEVRRLNRGISTSNRDFLKLLDACMDLDIDCHVFFSSNLPFESKETFNDTLKLMERLVEKGITNISCGNLSIEPASPIFMYPKKYDVISNIGSFMNYYDMLKKKQKSYNPSGYHTSQLSEKDSMALIKVSHSKWRELIGGLNRRPDGYSFY